MANRRLELEDGDIREQELERKRENLPLHQGTKDAT